MTLRRIVVRPVQQTALRIPLIFAHQGQAVPRLQAGEARGQVDIVSHQQRGAAIGADDEALMPRSVTIIGQYAGNCPIYGYLLAAAMVLEGLPRGVGNRALRRSIDADAQRNQRAENRCS